MLPTNRKKAYLIFSTAEFARTKGAKDLRRRKKAGTGRKLKQLESGSRSIANLGKGINSISKIIREARTTAKFLGINPASTKALNEKVGLLHRIKSTREGVNLVNATARGGMNVRRLLNGKKAASHVFIHHIRST